MTKTKRLSSKESALDRWKGLVASVISDAERWALKQEWSTHRMIKRMNEPPFGEYEVPTLRIRLPEGEVRVDPVALYVVGADARINLEAWPSGYRVNMLLRRRKWILLDDSYKNLHRRWNESDFVKTSRELVMK